MMMNKQTAQMSKNTKMTSSSNKPFRMPENLSEFLIQEERDIKQERRRQRTLPMHKRGLEPRETSHQTLARHIKAIEEEEWKEAIKNTKLNAPKKLKTEEVESGLFHVGTRRDFHDMEREKSRLQFFIQEGQKKVKSVKKQICSVEKERAIDNSNFSDEALNKHVQQEVIKTNRALKSTYEEDKALLEMQEEVKRTSGKVMEVKMNLTKKQKELIHFDMCKDFLWGLSPPEWQKPQEAKNQTADKIRAAAKAKESAEMGRNTDSNIVLPPLQLDPNTKFFQKNHNIRKKTPEDEEEGIVDNLECFEEPHTFFTDPKELRKIIARRDQDITLVFKEFDFTERLIEICKKEHDKLEQSMDVDRRRIIEEIDRLIRKFEEKKAKAVKLQKQTKDYKENESFAKMREKEKLMLNKIRDMFCTCIGEPVNSRTIRQMFGSVEYQMCKFLGELDIVPQDKLKPIMTAFRKEKAIRLRREDMLRREMIKEEEWRRRAELRRERSQRELKRPVGKKVMWRSFLEKQPLKEKNKVSVMTEEQELENFLLS